MQQKSRLAIALAAAALGIAAGMLGWRSGGTDHGSAGASELPPILPDGSGFTQGSSPTLYPLGCFYASSINNLSSGTSGAVRCTNNRDLVVSIDGSVTIAGGGGVSATDEAAFTAGTSAYTPVGGTYNTGNINLSSGQGGAAQLSKERRLVVNPYCKPEDCVSGATSTTGTGSTQIIAGVASTKLCITELGIANTSSTDSLITLQDGSGGTALWYTVAPAKNGFGGSNVTLPAPVCTTSGNGLYFAAGTAATTIYVSAGGFKAS